MNDTAVETHSPNAVLEVRVTCPPVLAAYVEELLWTIDGVESVSEIYTPKAGTDTVLPSDLTYISLITRNPLGEDLFKVLMVENPKLMKVCDIVGTRWLETEDWAESWKQYWKPTHVSEKLTICPTWEEYAPQSADETVIRLDPEWAFGTGTHETTQLMLKALEKLSADIDFSQVNLLDVGTGSGILAVYAALLGCRDVRGVDNDTLAVQTAVQNAQINGVEDRADFTDTSLADLCRTQYDVVLVNIIAPVILELFDEMLLRLKPGGRLIASGLIESSVGKVDAAMRAAGFSDIETVRQGDWFSLSGVYKA